MRNMRILILLSFLVLPLFATAQVVAPPAALDTSKIQGEMPKLEIPEITIVGKKAITLPFARKGEIFDVDVYEAPPPDSSILLTRPILPLPVGQYNKYEERINVWRVAVDGSLGSFSTAGGNGYVNYKSEQWDFYGSGGFLATGGRSIDNFFAAHPPTMNASANNVHGEFDIRTLLPTDNDFLKTLRFFVASKFFGEQYNYFGIDGVESNRVRQNSFLTGGFGSVNRQGTVLDFNLSVNNWNINDARTSLPDSQVSLISPKIQTTLATDFGRFRFVTDLEYASSSLNYQHPTQSPTSLNWFSGLRWQVLDRWFLQAGGYYGYGTASDGGSKTILMPSAVMNWDIDAAREFTVWWKPELQLQSYAQLTLDNPYLDRELVLRPIRTPVNIGASFWFNEPYMVFEVQGSLKQSSNRPVTLSDHGRMTIAYLDAVESIVEFKGSLLPFKLMTLKYSGKINRAVPKDGDTQFPMTPLVTLHGTGEFGLTLPVKIYFSGDYTSPRNIDLNGAKQLTSTLLFGTGVSTTVIPNAVLSLDIANILNTSYYLWDGYPAPGIDLSIGLKYKIQ
ncbi:MAG: hypothetical protein ACHQQQ_05250 [Bacteroidota bacterium]